MISIEYEAKETIEFLQFYEVLKEFLELYSNEFIGNNIYINVENVAKYLNSGRYLTRFKINKVSKDELFKEFESDILNGYPIWELLNISDWTRNILELEFKETVKNEFIENCKKYKCLTCKYYKEKHTSFGVIIKCNIPKTGYRRIMDNGVLHELKEECNDYIKGVD